MAPELLRTHHPQRKIVNKNNRIHHKQPIKLGRRFITVIVGATLVVALSPQNRPRPNGMENRVCPICRGESHSPIPNKTHSPHFVGAIPCGCPKQNCRPFPNNAFVQSFGYATFALFPQNAFAPFPSPHV